MEVERRAFFASLAGVAGSAKAVELLQGMPEPDSVKKVALGPDHVVVLEYPGMLSELAAKRIQESWRQIFGENGPRVVVLEEGMRAAAVFETASR